MTFATTTPWTLGGISIVRFRWWGRNIRGAVVAAVVSVAGILWESSRCL